MSSIIARTNEQVQGKILKFLMIIGFLVRMVLASQILLKFLMMFLFQILDWHVENGTNSF